MEAPKSQEKLNENIALVRGLLEKQRLVETVVHSRDSRKHDLVESLVHRQHLAELQTKVGRLHAADIAHILEVLPSDDRSLIWKLMADTRGGDILLEVSDAVRGQLIDAMSSDELLAVLQQIDGDDPALGSSIILTAATDSLGFFIFLSLATVFLLH